MQHLLVVANWKMNGSLSSNRELVEGFLNCWGAGNGKTAVALCPPAVYLSQVSGLLQASDVELGAQDVSSASSGAYTGEVSAEMLAEMGCSYALVGHSERREYHAESNDLVAAKFAAVQQQGLIPILCVGETLEQREAEQTLAVIGEQLRVVMECVGESAMENAVVAYEPVWAIGTGLTATPEQAQQVHEFIRRQLGDVGSKVKVLYGGSVKPSNAAELFGQKDIDGALVGGASLNSEDFFSICSAAS